MADVVDAHRRAPFGGHVLGATQSAGQIKALGQGEHPRPVGLIVLRQRGRQHEVIARPGAGDVERAQVLVPLLQVGVRLPEAIGKVDEGGGVFLGGGAARLDGGLAAGFFLLVDFGFFASRLLRF